MLYIDNQSCLPSAGVDKLWPTSQSPVLVNKGLVEHSPPINYMLSMADLALQWQSLLVATVSVLQV